MDFNDQSHRNWKTGQDDKEKPEVGQNISNRKSELRKIKKPVIPFT
jgi:hypothetical protein